MILSPELLRRRYILAGIRELQRGCLAIGKYLNNLEVFISYNYMQRCVITRELKSEKLFMDFRVPQEDILKSLSFAFENGCSGFLRLMVLNSTFGV